MEEQTFYAALAGLLHDVGKFAQRQEKNVRSHTVVGSEAFTQIFERVVPFNWQDDIGDAIRFHHSRNPNETGKEIVKAVTVADWLTSAERLDGHPEQIDPKNTPLMPITARVELDTTPTNQNWGFQLGTLSTKEADLFPNSVDKIAAGETPYQTLWQQFVESLATLPGPIDNYSSIAGLMSLLRQYTTHIPSATPWATDNKKRTVPDVSLYDHLKVTAAIASCLLNLYPDHLNDLHKNLQGIMKDGRPVAQLIRGDLSGIQKFIYRITEPARERQNRSVAKRLRGRSFYLSMLTEVVAEWFLRELGLTAANALFVGGGRFDLLVPVDQITSNKVSELEEKLEKWLVSEFDAAIGLVLATEQLTPNDFENMQRVNFALDDKLVAAKQKKFSHNLSVEFFEAESYLQDANKKGQQVCDVCGLSVLPTGNQRICDLCEQHKEIGTKLPKTRYLARIYPFSGSIRDFSRVQTTIVFDGLQTAVVLLNNEAEVDNLLDDVEKAGVEAAVYALNDEPLPAVTWSKKTAPARMYLANTAPQHYDGDVLEFGSMAALSTGTALLGVLKADVDHLGLVFSLGLEPPTISRVAALSHQLDRFFSGYLNSLCREVTADWKGNLSDEEKKAIANKATKAGETEKQINLDTLESLFYVTYAGGDDLLIIGPWDQTIGLAQKLNEKFRAYTCKNPNITISAGIALVKPHFPVQRFVELADEALDKAKNAHPEGQKGRNQITLFGQTVKWRNGATGFESLKQLADDLLPKVQSKDMPRGLIHDMLQMRRESEIKTRPGEYKVMIKPQLLYLLTRRLPKTVRDDFKDRIFKALPNIQLPLSYVSLKTRKE